MKGPGALIAGNVALLAGSAFIGYLADANLHGRVPIHFGISGRPDCWSGMGGYWMLVAIQLGLTALFFALGLFGGWLRRYPHLLNVPQRERFLALPPERREPVFEYLEKFFMALGMALNLVFLLLEWGIYLVGSGHWEKLPMSFLLLPGAVVLGVAAAGTIGLKLVISRLVSSVEE